MRPPSRHNGNVQRGSELAGRRVLVVDDDRTNIRLVKDGLSRLAGKDRPLFAEAHDGQEALAKIRDWKPDIVVMDVEMPKYSGVDVCRIVKGQPQVFGFVPVILMTARGGGGKIEGLELGADDYLVKPFDILELGARVSSMLRLKTLQDELSRVNGALREEQGKLKKVNEQLQALSRTDGLTGLMNRRYFNERFAEEFARSHRYRNALTLMMVDIDHFKQLNDGFGHPFGDVVLKETAGVVRETLRTGVDIVARYGGEEIACVMPETAGTEGRIVAERLRQRVADQEYVSEDGRAVSVTVSVGVASFPVDGIDDADAFLRAADEALYRAKQAGRNCVRLHEESLE
jgi:diguanylate cyclase (GGDEF)-like protein